MKDFENKKSFSDSEKFLDKDNYDNDEHDDINEEDEDKSSANSNARIKKLHSFDFFLNNLYFCFKKRKHKNYSYV